MVDPLGEGQEGGSEAMAITPEEIEQRSFAFVRRGYDTEEVDTFLAEVAATLRDAQAESARLNAELAAEPPPPPPPPETPITAVTAGGDDFSRLGEEVAAVLRQAHESVARLREQAEAEAQQTRHEAEAESALLREQAQRELDEANNVLNRTQAEADAKRAEIQREADATTEQAVNRARARTREIIEQAKLDARAAIDAQRAVRERLEGTRGDVDRALERLADDVEARFDDIDLVTPLPGEGEGENGGEPPSPPPGQGPPTPPVPPPLPGGSGGGADFYRNLPYDEEEPEVPGEGDAEGEPDEGGPVVDLTGDQPVVDTTESESPPDPLARMVQSAVERALRRRQDEPAPEPPDDVADEG